MLAPRGYLRAFLLALPLLASACAPPPPVRLPVGEAVVYVIARGWHTDIGLPVDEITGPLAMLEAGYPGVRFLTFGFGERQFVVDRRTNLLGMLHALLPSRSAVLMTALRTTPDVAFGGENVVALRVTRTGLAGIEAAIWQELERSADDKPLQLAGGPYGGSVFYAARDTYDGLFTCNTWTAKIIRTGGIPMPLAGILFSSQVVGMARWFSTHQSEVSALDAGR